MVRLVDRAVGATVSLGRWLALPVVLLLFLQWPLRDAVRAWSREANDLGQCFFALLVAIAVTAATRARAHLAAEAFAARYPAAARGAIERLAGALVLIPWVLFVLAAGWPNRSCSSSMRRAAGQQDGGPRLRIDRRFRLRLSAGVRRRGGAEASRRRAADGATQAPRFSAQIGNPIATASAPASGVVALPSALLQAADGPSAPVLLAKITLALPPLAHSGDLAVVVDAPGGDTGGGNVIPLSMFGHHIVQGPVTFTVPLGPPVAALRAKIRSAANTLNFSVAQPAAVAMPTAHAHGADARVEVLSIVVEAH